MVHPAVEPFIDLLIIAVEHIVRFSYNVVMHVGVIVTISIRKLLGDIPTWWLLRSASLQ